MARKNPLPENERCRGRHSKCGGVNPAKSASWHLCAGPGSCTEKYRAMKKAEAAAKPKVSPAKATPPKVVPIAARKPPAPKREPVSRVPVAAMVAPEVNVTKS